MFSEKNLHIMVNAYRLMYEIENFLRRYIRQEMNIAFGPNWFHIAPRTVLKRPPSKSFENLLFPDYERLYLRTYSEVFKALPQDFYMQLHVLYPLRNKIAHCHNLNDKEYKELTSTHSFLVSILKNTILSK